MKYSQQLLDKFGTEKFLILSERGEFTEEHI
jgi:hypothetical protein